MDQFPVDFPQPPAWYDRLVLHLAHWEQCQGVPVAVAAYSSEQRIRTRMGEALSLLAKYSPMDLERLRRFTRGIIVTRLYGSRAEWRQSIRACVISTDYVRQPNASASAVAASLVHEVMHARLDAAGFDYGNERRGRIEQICFRASERFLRKLPPSPERDDALREVEEYVSFDPDIWSEMPERLNRDQPWFIRALRFAVHRIPKIWHREPNG